MFWIADDMWEKICCRFVLDVNTFIGKLVILFITGMYHFVRVCCTSLISFFLTFLFLYFFVLLLGGFNPYSILFKITYISPSLIPEFFYFFVMLLTVSLSFNILLFTSIIFLLCLKRFYLWNSGFFFLIFTFRVLICYWGVIFCFMSYLNFIF